MGEIGSTFHQNNITIKASMSFRASDDIAEKLQELKVLTHTDDVFMCNTIDVVSKVKVWWLGIRQIPPYWKQICQE